MYIDAAKLQPLPYSKRILDVLVMSLGHKSPLHYSQAWFFANVGAWHYS